MFNNTLHGIDIENFQVDSFCKGSASEWFFPAA
jgi:hypothetical protein